MQKHDEGLDQARVEGTKVLFALPMASEVEATLTKLLPPSVLAPDIPRRRPFDTRRIVDIACALVLLALLAPLLLLISVLVVMTSPGPAIFSHRRLGLDGTTFLCLKFRSMRSDAVAVLPAILACSQALREQWERDHKLASDPRVTPLGRVLRATSLDELPQLINVLRGDMTLVGPRPIVREELHHYGRYARHYFSVRPGLTGLWQVSGRSMTTYRRRVAADVYYVRSRSLLLDTRILLGTLPAVFSAEGSC
ncbi:sugar transferase [Novosphingobium aquiterrae]|uniref:Sugar transferase n=1 Tax=Novosphingobium aquiterrae TaxID=624388 RepID=A0ABV6PEH0_9SPHN